MIRFQVVVLAIFSLFFSAAGSRGQEIYRQTTNPGIQTFVSEYGISGSWHLECTKQTTGRGAGTRWCMLASTSGARYPATGIYKTNGEGPKIEIWNPSDRQPHAEIGLGYNHSRGVTLALEVGDQSFSKICGSAPGDQRWNTEEVRGILPLLMKGSVVRYRYERVSGKASLSGFTKAWNYAVKFVAYDPLAK